GGSAPFCEGDVDYPRLRVGLVLAVASHRVTRRQRRAKSRERAVERPSFTRGEIELGHGRIAARGIDFDFLVLFGQLPILVTSMVPGRVRRLCCRQKAIRPRHASLANPRRGNRARSKRRVICAIRASAGIAGAKTRRIEPEFRNKSRSLRIYTIV